MQKPQAMRSVLALLAALVLMTACQNQAQEKNAAATDNSGTADAVAENTQDNTTIQWIDSARDMGTINEGVKLEVAFRFKNTGNKPLVIKHVQPACGCTAADIPNEPIAPGQEGVIKGVFDSHGREGTQNKTMTVYTNTEAKQHTVSFSVNVKKKST